MATVIPAYAGIYAAAIKLDKRWRMCASRVREAARNNLPTSLALPFDRLRTSNRLRERSMGKLFPGGSLT
jgi:hypothetical protein